MRAQDGSPGCMVAQEREVIRGCAADVSGAREVRVGGRVSRSGKRMGEMKGLGIVSILSYKVAEPVNIRILKPRLLCQTIYNPSRLRPR